MFYFALLSDSKIFWRKKHVFILRCKYVICIYICIYIFSKCLTDKLTMNQWVLTFHWFLNWSTTFWMVLTVVSHAALEAHWLGVIPDFYIHRCAIWSKSLNISLFKPLHLLNGHSNTGIIWGTNRLIHYVSLLLPSLQSTPHWVALSTSLFLTVLDTGILGRCWQVWFVLQPLLSLQRLPSLCIFTRSFLCACTAIPGVSQLAKCPLLRKTPVRLDQGHPNGLTLT